MVGPPPPAGRTEFANRAAVRSVGGGTQGFERVPKVLKGTAGRSRGALFCWRPKSPTGVGVGIEIPVWSGTAAL
jgi:hypothetical protein